MLSPSKGRVPCYLQLINKGEDNDLFKTLSRNRWPSMLGTAQFKEWVKNKFFEGTLDLQVSASSELAPVIERIKASVCREYKVSEKVMRYSRRGYFNEPRDVAIYLVRYLRKDTLPIISQAFSMNGYSSVSSSISRIEKKLEDKKLSKRIEKLRSFLKGQT